MSCKNHTEAPKIVAQVNGSGGISITTEKPFQLPDVLFEELKSRLGWTAENIADFFNNNEGALERYFTSPVKMVNSLATLQNWENNSMPWEGESQDSFVARAATAYRAKCRIGSRINLPKEGTGLPMEFNFPTWLNHNLHYYDGKDLTVGEWTNEFMPDAKRMAVFFSEPQDVGHIKNLMGFSGTVDLRLYDFDAEDMNAVDQKGDKARIFVWELDMARTNSGNTRSRFTNDLKSTFVHGSPIRTTNKSGEGTKGTRLVEGVGLDTEMSFAFAK